jgi:hypothetical protein
MERYEKDQQDFTTNHDFVSAKHGDCLCCARMMGRDDTGDLLLSRSGSFFDIFIDEWT